MSKKSMGVWIRGFGTKTEAEKMAKVLAKHVLGKADRNRFFHVHPTRYAQSGKLFYELRFRAKDFKTFAYTFVEHIPMNATQAPLTSMRWFLSGYLKGGK